MDSVVLAAMARELDGQLVGARLQKLSQLTEADYVLHLRKPGKTLKLLICLRSGESRLHLVTGSMPPAQIPSAFVMLCRKHLEGKPVERVAQPGLERVVELEFRDGWRLMVEIPGRSNNLVLINPGETVVGLAGGSPHAKPGKPYRMPARPPLPEAWNLSGEQAASLVRAHPEEPARALAGGCFGLPRACARELLEGSLEQLPQRWEEFWGQLRHGQVAAGVKPNGRLTLRPGSADRRFATLSEAARAAWPGASAQPGLDQRRQELVRRIARRLAAARRKHERRLQDHQRACAAELDKVKADLLLAYASTIEPGASSVKLPAWQADDPPVQVELDPRLGVSDNAQRYYARYRKRKRGQQVLSEQIGLAADEVTFLEELLLAAEQAACADELEEAARCVPGRGKAKRRPQAPDSGPRRYRFGGFEILVGRNPAQNDRLSGRIAASDDLWFHARDIPGSHVILRTAGREPDEEAILAAAVLAARYSKAGSSSKVPVAYTRARYLKKPPGSPPGKVLFRNEKTILVDPAIRPPGLHPAGN